MAERSVRLFAAIAGGKAMAMALALLLPVLIGRLLGPSGLGRWTLLLAAGTLLHTALVNWTHVSTVRYGREEWVVAGGLNRTLGARLPFVALSLGLAVFLAAAQPFDWLHRWFAADGSGWWMVVLCLASVWLAAEAQATLQATDRLMWQAVLSPLTGALSVGALLLLAASGERSLASAVVAVAAPPVLLWGGAWLYGLVRSNTRPDRLIFQDASRHLRYALPMLPTYAVGYVSDWGDHLLLSRFGTLADVGLFGISYQFMVAIMAANGVLITLLLPRLIALELAQPGYVRTYVGAEIPALYALWMIGTVWVVAIVPAVVRLLAGPRFDASIGVLLVLLVAIPSSIVTSLYSVLFSVQERTGRVLAYVSVMAFTNLGASVVLIPKYGAVGAAAGTVLSYIVYQVLYVWDQHRTVALPGVRTWTLTAAGFALGLSQLAVGAAAGVRVIWAVLATAVLVAIVRRTRCIDGGLVERLFAGRLRPVGIAITRVLVAAT